MAFEIAVERHAVSQEIANAIWAFVGNETSDVLIDDAAARRDRVGGVLCRAVAFADCGGDAALGPHARRAFTERRCSDHRNRQRRELQRREEPGKAGTDDHDVAETAAGLRRLRIFSRRAWFVWPWDCLRSGLQEANWLA